MCFFKLFFKYLKRNEEEKDRTQQLIKEQEAILLQIQKKQFQDIFLYDLTQIKTG